MASAETTRSPETTPEEVVNTVVDEGRKVGVRRFFTLEGRDPFDEIEWELRTAFIPGKDKPVFEQKDVEFPKFWSQTATNIVAQKYFRGRMSSPERERSVKQMIGRIVDTVGGWGRDGGYFADEAEAETFEAELKAILVNQMAAFNSPVWFNVGFEEKPQCSACQPYHALVSTPDGMVPIGELVEGEHVGREVYDADGVTHIVAVKHNGRKPVYRVTLRNGQWIEATPDHVVKAVAERRTTPEWLRVDQLEVGMRMHLHPHRAKVAQPVLVPAGVGSGDSELPEASDAEVTEAAEAALAGWLQANGFVGQYDHGTNRSLTIEFQVANDDEFDWVMTNLDAVFPYVHRHVRDVTTEDTALRCRRIRLYGEPLRDFVEGWELLARGVDIRVPKRLWTSSHDVITAYLLSIFQADGYVSVRREEGSESGRVGFAVIGEKWAEDVQLLLNVIGIYSRRLRKRERRADRHDLHDVQIAIGSERARFAELVGFVGREKQAKLLESLTLRGLKQCPDLREEEIVSIEPRGVQEVYDIQTDSGEYLSNNVAVHNCFILSIDDSMEDILDWIRREGIIFRGGSGSGVNLSKLRSSKEQLSKGGYASGPVSFMRGADASAGTIKSGGKTRRAAKMVVLDIDHPDVEEFIWCKAKEERKARVLEQAGYDMSLDSSDWASIQYQNANNSVRVTDAFMEAAQAGKEWNLTARTDGTVIDTVDAKSLLDQMSQAAWECADPGVQYDTTINSWHTLPNTGRINASNPCFPGDARVHTTRGLLTFQEVYDLASEGEEFRVYTHRATAEKPGEGVVATKPLAVMQNGVKPILRLRFSNGQELRCTPNHRLWTINRGYVAAGELTDDDRVLLNDSATPAEDASWTLPLKMEVAARSRSGQGGALVEQDLPERWSEGLAELTGHLVGDGWLTDVQTGWVYGGDDIEDGLLSSHEGLLRELIGGISVQRMQNGTVQLRAGSEAVRMFFHRLGVSAGSAHTKRVPVALFSAPAEVQAAFLRGLFGADGCVSRVESGNASRYVGLGSRSDALLRDVQRLLSTFGIRGRIYAISGSDGAKFEYTRNDGSSVEYEAKQGFDLRITGSDLEQFASAIGFSTPRKQAALETLLETTTRYETKPGTTLVSREDDGQEVVYNLTEPLHHSYIVDGFVVANCSEYMSIDDSACNLASINLLKFRKEDGEFDVDAFEHTCDTVFLAQEILVGYSSYPTPEIESNAKAYRQLGLGYTNLGALLMARGLPYDSDEGRAYAAAITALMTGRAYRKSAEIAGRMGPFAGYRRNAAAMLGVIAKHRAAVGNIEHSGTVAPDLLAAARKAWDDAMDLGEVAGYRNAQSTVLAPTGTISFLMDSDTTGVEPDFSLVKSKKLVGGGEITIVNKTVPMALEKLGYTPGEREEVVAYLDERNTIVGAPYVKAEHYPVFDCAVGERAIHYMGHVKMMGAVQPFISGAISKCVVGETLVSTAEGLVRIGSLYRGEDEDTFRPMELPLSSLDGLRATDAFYYGGVRSTLEIELRSGHRVVGTPNHRVLVGANGGLEWRRLDELEEGDQVAVQYGDDLWSERPASFGDFMPSAPYGSQKRITVPVEMTEDLAFFLGAYAAEGHTTRSVHTIRIANADESVVARLVELAASLFDIEARVARWGAKCPSVELSSKTLVEFFDYLGCGDRAATKRVPDAVLRSPRSMVLAFLEGLSLDSYIPAGLEKWAICLASNGLLDDLQAVLTNLGVVHSRIRKWNSEYERSFDEVYASGRSAQKLVSLLRFPEAHKGARAAAMLERAPATSPWDVVPGADGRALYQLIPSGRSGRSGRGTSRSKRFRHLVDPRTAQVSRASLETVATVEGVELPEWLQTVLSQNLHFAPVREVRDSGEREVFDVSVPVTNAFVGNGIVNHNTVNLPEETTVEEISQLWIEAWQLGVKAIAIYRDNCKVAQPLSGKSDKSAAAPLPGVPAIAPPPLTQRRRLPEDRTEVGRKFRVGEYEGYIHVGLYDDGSPGDIFVDIAKDGTTMAGLMNSLMIAVSMGLQYGVPPEVYVSKLSHMRFEPSGLTNDADIRAAKSIVDYIFRWFGKKFLTIEQQEEAGILSPEVKARLAANYAGEVTPTSTAASAEAASPGQTALFNAWEDAVECARCGGRMVRTGSCYTCRDCGTNTGCS